MPVIKGPELIENRIRALQEFHKEARQPKAELDISGGIDSAVMAWLLVRALGPKNVILVHTRIDTDPKQTDRAVRLAEALGAPFVNFDLTPFFKSLTERMEDDLRSAVARANLDALEIACRVEKDQTILGSIRSTLRAPVGRGFNRLYGGGIRHGTGNECEDRFLRFYQKGGDGEVDSNPLEMLSKTEVFQLAFAIAMAERGTLLEDLFRELISVKPSPDLWGKGDTHNDEDELASWTGVDFTYGRVDPDTGEILQFGTIERVARLLDQKFTLDDMAATGRSAEALGVKGMENILLATCETIMFGGGLGGFPGLASDRLVAIADQRGIFPLKKIGALPDKKPIQRFNAGDVTGFIFAAVRAERATRHKSNANIPTLGTRHELVDAGILSDKLEL